MKRKVLPIPVGAEAPQGSTIRRWQQHPFRTRLEYGVTILGLCLEAAGAWLGTHSAPLEVGVDGSGYHAGSTVLKAAGPGVYTGDSAVIVRSIDSRVLAVAVGRIGVESMQGRCTYVISANAEDCDFAVGKDHFHAHDTLSGGSWQRRYDNGRTLELKLVDPSRPSPVPIPLAWD